MNGVRLATKEQTLMIGTAGRFALYAARHPKWSWKVYQGYQQYMRQGGDFLDTDFYEVTMGQVIWRHFQHVGVSYKLTLRREVEFPEGFGQRLQEWVNHYATNHHSISHEQRLWLDKLPYLDPEYLAYLEDQSQPKIFAEHVKIVQTGGHLEVTIEGPAGPSSRWEEPMMAAISELYHREVDGPVEGWEWLERAGAKGRALKKAGAVVSEFGLRRRDSFKVQFGVVSSFVVYGAIKGPNDKAGILGTSNVYLAHLFGLTPTGTMAHKLFMIVGAIYGYDKANQIVIKLWRQEFGNALGYYLPDTFTTEEFLDTFSRDDALFFTGPRQDSGDPKHFVDLVVAYYQRMGLYPKQIAAKTIIFSDSLNVEKAIELQEYARSKGIGVAFGIGTFFTNDVGHPHLNMVIKAHEAWLLDNPTERRGCVKVSDDPGKLMGPPEARQQVARWLRTGEITWTPLRSIEQDFPELMR